MDNSVIILFLVRDEILQAASCHFSRFVAAYSTYNQPDALFGYGYQVALIMISFAYSYIS